MPPRIRRRRLRRRQQAHRLPHRVALGFLILPLAIAGAIAVAAAFGGQAAVRSTCSLNALRPLHIGENSFVFAADGSLLGSIPSSRNRQPLQLRDMSTWMPKATVAIEDRRFYQHGGLDYKGILRAAVTDIEKGTFAQGGSTITQQLVRNLYIGNDQRTLQRKLREACLALRLAASWPKNRILATYLNQVYYGNHAYGIEAAAQTYFSRSASRLTLAQSALLAGLPQAPSIYDPFDQPKVAKTRRNDVLAAMYASRYISFARYARAARRPLGLKPGSIYTRIRQPYFFSYVEDQLVAAFGASKVRSGGLRVRTTIDPRLQNSAELAMKNILRTKTDPSAALVAIDPRTGKIRAMAVDVPSGERLQFNLASQGHRQAGSAFKPFTLAAAIGEGISLSSTFNGPPSLLITDPRCSTNFQPWDVSNSADESAGTMSLMDATAASVNTIFAQLVVKVGPDAVVRAAHRMGIVSPLQAVCSITLGTQPVSPLEMTSAYGTIAAHGVRHSPESLEVVRGANGKVLGQALPAGYRVMPANDADLITAALQGVVTHGTGTAAAIGRPVAGKTGTAENYQDAWFCGYTPQLVTCVWVGYPHGEVSMQFIEGYPAVFGGTIPASIWRDFMSQAVANMPVQDFPPAFDHGQQVSGSGFQTSSTSATTTTATTTTAPVTTSAQTPPPATTTVARPKPPPPPTSPPPTTAPPPSPPPPTSTSPQPPPPPTPE